MNVLINLLPITSGGGLQVCLTFIKGVSKTPGNDYFFILAKDENEIADWLRSQDDLPYEIVPRKNLKRLYFELFKLNNLLVSRQIDVLYTFFGTLLRKPPVKLVMGCAYSNLFYPEIDFWRVGLFRKQLKKAIDFFRLNSYRKADLVVFENKGLADKAKNSFGFENVTVLLPSIAISDDPLSDLGARQLGTIRKDNFNLIMLSGWHVNKNIDKLISVARILRDIKKDRIVFNLSLSPHDVNVADFIVLIESENLQAYFNFVGRVIPTDVPHIVNQCDAVLLISTLESFSNNIIEAWAYQKPLIITDADWSRGACLNAACYVDINNPEAIARGVSTVASDREYRNILVRAGDERLGNFPSPKEKVQQHLSMLKSLYES